MPLSSVLLPSVVTLIVAFAAPASHEDRARSITTMNEGVQRVGVHDLTGAEAHMRKALELDPANGYAWLNLGHVYDRGTRTADAVRAFRSGVAVSEGTLRAELQLRLGEALLQQARDASTPGQRAALVGEARDVLQQAATAMPGWGLLHRRLAECHAQLDEPSLADDAYRRAIEADPTDAHAFVGLGRLYIDYGHLDLGMAVLEANVVANPTRVEAWTGKGEGLMQVGRAAEAVEAFEKAKRIDPDHLDALFGLGMAHAELLHRSESVDALQSYLMRAGSDQSQARKHAANNTIARMQDVI